MSFSPATIGILGMATQGLSTGIRSGAAYNDAMMENLAAQMNAATMERQAGNYRQAAAAERRLGLKEAEDVRRLARKTIGQQRALTGASGVKVDVGSSADLQVDTARWAEYDAQTALYGRDVSAFELDSKADNLDQQAKMTRATKRSPALAAGAQGLSGVSSMLSSYGGW